MFKIWIEIWKNLAISPEGNEKKLKYATQIWMKKVEIFHFWNLKWNYLKFSFLKWKIPFEIWKKWPYHQRQNEKKWNEEIIYLVYATEINI
jgi:hypothetical protein